MSFMFASTRASKTFKPKKNVPDGAHQVSLPRHAPAPHGSYVVTLLEARLEGPHREGPASGGAGGRGDGNPGDHLCRYLRHWAV